MNSLCILQNNLLKTVFNKCMKNYNMDKPSVVGRQPW